MTEARLAKLDHVAAHRSRHLSVVLENVYQSRTPAPWMRSAQTDWDCWMYFIENENAWSRNKGVAKGASQWLNLHRYLNAPDPRLACVESLKAKGIQVVVPHHTPRATRQRTCRSIGLLPLLWEQNFQVRLTS